MNDQPNDVNQPNNNSELPIAASEFTPQSENEFVAPMESRVVTPRGEVVSQPPRSRKKGVIIAAVIAAVVLLGASSAAAYNFWYQNPDKVVGDALMNAMQAKSMKYKGVATGNDIVSGTITMNGVLTRSAGAVDIVADLTNDGQKMKLSGGVVYDDKGDLYMKVSNVDELAKGVKEDQALPLSPNGQKLVDDFVTKVNDKWIKVSADDMKEFSPEFSKTQKCFQESFKKFQDDDSVSTEIVDLYKKHPFLTIKRELGSKDGSLGYEMGEDKAKAKEFGQGLKDTKFYKSLHECDSSIKLDDSVSGQDEGENRVELWVSRWSHEFTKISVVSDESKPDKKSTFTLEPEFNKEVTIKTPSESKSLKELVQDFQALQMAIMMEQMKAQGVTMDMAGPGLASEL